MDRTKELWWEEEVNGTFQMIKKISFGLQWVLIPLWGINIYLQFLRNSNSILFFILAGVHWMLCHYIASFENQNVNLKCIATIVFSEYNCFIWKFISMNELEEDNKIIYSVISFATIAFCELPFIKSSKLRIFVVAKFFLVWYYDKYLMGYESINISSSVHFVSFIIACLCEVRCERMMMRSFQRFLSRKNLENAEKRLNLIFNLFPHGILIISDRNEILYSNTNVLRLLNCELAQLISIISDIEYCQGRKQSDLSSSNKLIDHISLIPSLELNQQISLGVSKFGTIYLEWRAQRVLWGEQNGILLTVSNVNHIIQLEKTTSDNKLKNVLLRSVSHELRTPINSIKSLAESLKNDPEISPCHPWKEKLNIISVSSNLLISLINDLLDYSKVLVGMFSIQKSNFALWNNIHEVIQLIKIQASKKGLQVLTRIDPQLPINVYTDPLRLSQVLLNLLSNALKFTLKGSIEICCMLNEKNQLKITVKDTGIGISDENMKNLFKEFNTNLDKDLNPVGCGLGLWISNIIAQELGSSIKVKSKIHEGSSFSFCVDIFDNKIDNFLFFESGKKIEIPKENKLHLSIKSFDKLLQEEKTQVLIVDDNDFNRLALGSLLASYKIFYNEACTGKEAIVKVMEMNKRRKPYKLIIMDGSMPELNGWEATKIIYGLFSDGKIDSLPAVLGYTAFTSDVELSLCIESGMKECIIKPCNSEILINKIIKYLSI